MTDPSPAAPPRCRVCAAEVAPDAVRCARCGAAQREEICPHCGGTAGASPHEELRLRCDVCGGPRVPPSDPSIKRSGREVAALRRAHAAASARSGYRVASVVGGVLLGFDLLVFSLLILIIGAGFGLLLAGLITVLPLVGFMLWARGRAGARGREIAPALDAAWLSVAADIARQTQGPLTAHTLASALRIEEPQAEELLALLEVHNEVRGAMTPGGDMAYNPRLRVAAAGEAPANPSARAAEEEALAAEEAAVPPARRTADADPTNR